jgi:putative transcriptional regulator
VDSLKEAREKRGIKQFVVADAIGVTRQTYAKYEDNPGKMPVSLAQAACAFIGCDISQIFFGKAVSKTEQ